MPPTPHNASKEAARNASLEQASGYFGNYAEYNKLLRTWFVAFGIGGPALLYTRPELLEKLSDLHRSWVIWAFLAGSGIQVFLAALNKYLSWQEYRFLTLKAANPDRRRSWIERSGAWISGQFWIDVLFDLSSMALFGYSIILLTSAALRIGDPAVIVTPPD